MQFIEEKEQHEQVLSKNLKVKPSSKMTEYYKTYEEDYKKRNENISVFKD